METLASFLIVTLSMFFGACLDEWLFGGWRERSWKSYKTTRWMMSEQDVGEACPKCGVHGFDDIHYCFNCCYGERKRDE